MSGNEGQYYPFGISSGIDRAKCPSSGTIQLQFNLDSLPLFKSSKTELWPILCLVFGGESGPFAVGIYCGKSKPKKLDEFLCDFIEDLNKLLIEGIVINGVRRSVVVHRFVCDAPARSYIKNVKLYSGCSGCERCDQEGEYVDGKVTFPLTSSLLRTDEDFRQITDDEHHHGPSPLTSLGFGMVTCFVLDYMHLVCQGVVRRIITFWLRGPIHKDTMASRLPARMVSALSTRLINLAAFVPQELARKPRAVAELDRWKATEFRQFLLYTGMVVLPGIVNNEVFNHFMKLSVAITLLCSSRYCEDPVANDYAQKLLVSFVELAKLLYGPGFMVYNVHCLVHLAADAKQFGSLDGISAFPFENHLKHLKRMVRKTSLPLPQIVRRISEQRAISKPSTLDNKDEVPLSVKGEHYDGPVPCGYAGAQQFSQLSTGVCVITLHTRDNCVAFKDVCKPSRVRNILLINEEYFLVCEELLSPTDLFLEPLPSSCLDIYKVSTPCGNLKVHAVSGSLMKYICFPLPNQSMESSEAHSKEYFAALPLLHCCVTTGKQ